MGVMHGDEIMFVFGDALKRFTSNNYSLEDRQLSQQMMTYWTNFAKTRSAYLSVYDPLQYRFFCFFVPCPDLKRIAHHVLILASLSEVRSQSACV